jgi:uncharacterized protein (TIGR02145 family)
MKRIFFLMLMLGMMSAASMNAQVRIGGTDDPNQSTVLDLNATDIANSGDLGLALPRVVLTSETALLNGAVPPNGTVVYNTGGDLNEGIYYWTGGTSGQWSYVSGLVPKITTQPKRFTFDRLKDTNGDPDAPAFTEKTLTVVASGPGLTYQWYQKAKNPNAPDMELAGATTPTYTFPVPNESVANWGLYQYYCVVSNAYGSVKSDVADIAVGCGAKTADGGWLKFMCHNLGALPVGADQSLDEITFDTNSTVAGGDTISSDAKGWLFQWGRIADGHQWRSSAIVEGPYHSETNVEVPPDDATYYGKFITNNDMVTAYDWRTPPYARAWRNWPDGRYPCPTGWKVPSSSDWSTLYGFGTSYGSPDKASSNAWIWKNKGYVIRPDGVTTTLFLPAAGSRRYETGLLDGAELRLNYWSCTANAEHAFDLANSDPYLSTASAAPRGLGASVRCVAE